MAEDYVTSTPEGAAEWARAHAEPDDDDRPTPAELAADEEADPRDLACTDCNGYPCICDDIYERYRDYMIEMQEREEQWARP